MCIEHIMFLQKSCPLTCSGILLLVCVDEENVIFLVGAKGCEEIAQVVKELLARVGVRNVLHG